MSMLGLQGSFLILDILSLAQDTLPFAGRNSGDIVHHVQQHFQFRFQLRHYSLQPYQKPQARQLRQPEQNIQVLPVLIYTFMELRVGISQAAIEQWGYGNSESTQTFPIKFTNSVIGIYGSKRAINYEYTFAATSITNTNFFMSTRNSEGNSRVIACNWLAIGQQQTK